MTTMALCLHVLLAAVLVGPQFLLFLAVVPSTWLIADEPLRRSVTRVVTQRFGIMTGIALIGLLITGLYQFTSSLVPSDVRTHLMDYRYGTLFIVKMLLVLILIAMIGVHGAMFGRRIRSVSEAVERGDVEPSALEAARRNSLMFSFLILAASILVLLLGVALSSHSYSLVHN